LLLGLVEAQRSDAQCGERKRRFRGLGLDLAQELVADSLDLFADVELGGVEVD
jgi:hypothetical protein